MSTSKLFERVFGEDIFSKIIDEREKKKALEDNDDEGACSNKPKPPEKNDDLTLKEQITIVKNWLQTKLDTIDAQCQYAIQIQNSQRADKIGPHFTIFDIDYSSTVRVSSDRLSLRSQGSFNTVKGTSCVHKGRWMYEIALHTNGVMQLGWCSNRCAFNENSGVGDTKWSFGFDGSKQQAWHISTHKYGDKWQIGDIIGLTIDLDAEKIEYFRNGKSMGVAFTKIEKGPGISFYPAVSLGYNQGIQANFGNFPLKYPVDGYFPLNEKPIARIEKSNLLLGYMENLAAAVSRYSCCKEKDSDKKEDDKNKKKPFSTKKTVFVMFGQIIMDKLSVMLLDTYVIEDPLLMRISHLCESSFSHDGKATSRCTVLPGAPESHFGALLSLLWNSMETEELKFVLKKLLNAILSNFCEPQKRLDYEKQRRAIHILTCLCNHIRTRKTYLEIKFFKKHCLGLLMYLRPPDYLYMEEIIPEAHAWTESLGGPKAKYLSHVETIRHSTETLYADQKNLFMTLLTNTDGSDESPSSRKILLNKIRRYVMDISLEQRPFHSFFLMQSSIHHPIDAPVALSFVCILLDTVKTLLDREIPGVQHEIELKYFIDGTFSYGHFDRVGGVLTHLRKVHRNEVIQLLGTDRASTALNEDRNVIRMGELDPGLFVTGQNINSLTAAARASDAAGNTFTHFFNPRVSPPVETTPGNSEVSNSLYELLDIACLYYYSVGHKYIVDIAALRDEISVLNEVMRDTKVYREDIEKRLQVLEDHAKNCMNDNHCHIMAELKNKFSLRDNVFAKHAIELSRRQAWYRAVALGKQRRENIIYLLEKVMRTLNASSSSGSLFAFVPEIYINILPIILDTVMDFSFHELMVQFEFSDAECVINCVADFLSLHSADSRIILASCKDSLLQALGTVTCHRGGIRAMERAPKKSQNALVRSLLRPYENRAWGQSNWLLLRFWLGEGFGYRDPRQPCVWQGGSMAVPLGLCRSRAVNETHTGLLHHIAPACPSRQFQRLIGAKLTEDEPFATTFLNSVLSQLNWAFSEFILLLQEIQNTAHRQDTQLFEPKQMKICSMCFELTVSLMRCLEMIISVAPNIIQDASRPNSDLLLNRICQLISQVLSRVTVPPGCFQFVVDLCSADLNSVTHFPIISAALGILVRLMRTEIDSEQNPVKVTRITRAFLTDPSFQFAHLEFALGEVKTPILQQSEIPRGNFDPQTRAHIDPLTNDVRVPMPTSSNRRIRTDPPIIKFSLSDYPTHVTPKEIEDIRRLIDMLRAKQALLSDITLPSEDSLCPICCAKPIAVIFTPCNHQSCSNCILQHLMNSKVCFYCKTLIKTIETPDGAILYQNNEYTPAPTIFEQI